MYVGSMGIHGGDLYLYVLLMGNRPYFLVPGDVGKQSCLGHIDLIAKIRAFPVRAIVVI